MIHRIEISEHANEFLQDLMDLADMEYSIDRSAISSMDFDRIYYVEGPTSKFRKILGILRENGIHFASTIDKY